MKNLSTVIKFTMKEMIKRKSFIISTLIILILIVIGFNVPNILKSIKGEDSEEKLLIADNQNIFEGTLESIKNFELDYEIQVENASYDEIKRKIENKEVESAILIEKQDENIKIRYIVENMNFIKTFPEKLVNIMNTLYSNLQISKLDLTAEQIQSITPNFEFDLEQTEEEKASGNVFAMMLLSLVLFYAIYFCAYQVSSSITTEKTSKIMETLVTSTSPKIIVLRKNNWNRNSWINTNDFNSWNCYNKCKIIFRFRNDKCSFRYV